MGCKYVKDFEFSADHGYTGSAKGYATGGKVTPAVREAVHKHERAMHPNEPLTALKKGGACKGYAKGGITEKATGERYASKAEMIKHERRESPREQREEVMQKTRQVRRGPAMAAGVDPRVPMLKKGGKVEKVMHEFGQGKLHSGSTGKVVTNPKQAVAIALSEERRSKK